MCVANVFSYETMKILTHGDLERRTTSGRVAETWLGVTREIELRLAASCHNLVNRGGRFDLKLPAFVVQVRNHATNQTHQKLIATMLIISHIFMSTAISLRMRMTLLNYYYLYSSYCDFITSDPRVIDSCMHVTFTIQMLRLEEILAPITDRLRTIMGIPRPEIRTHNIVFCPVGSPCQAWHTDDSMRQSKNHRYFTVLIGLNTIDSECGGTEIWSRVQKKGDMVSAPKQ
jgi:hypothetical protein